MVSKGGDLSASDEALVHRTGGERTERRGIPGARVRWAAGCLLVGLVCGLPAPSAAQGRAPQVALPLYDNGTESFIALDLASGDCILTDRLKNDPLQVRSRGLRQNLFREIGRRTDLAAFAGEILLAPILGSDGSTRAAVFVETSTGYLAFFDDVGRDNRLGTISVALDRPFESLASMDGNYALLMQRDAAGRTDGAYLYHATSGRASYYGGLRKLETVSAVVAVQGLPQLTGRVAAAAIQSTREQTVSYLVADGGNGDLYFFDLSANTPARMTARKSPLNLSEAFPEPGPHATPQRFVAVPLLSSDERTRQVFFVDASSGAMALLDDLDQQPALRSVAPNLYSALGPRTDEGGEASGPRVVTAVPAVGSTGSTVGIWLLDSASGAVAFVDGPRSPEQTAVRRVTVGG